MWMQINRTRHQLRIKQHTHYAAAVHAIDQAITRIVIPSQFSDGHQWAIKGHRWAFVTDDPIDGNRNFLITKIRSKRQCSKKISRIL